MGASLAQISIIIVLSVIGLPLFFFGLMAGLDRFERSLSAQPRVVTPRPGAAPGPAPAALPAAASALSTSSDDAPVTKLPTSPSLPPVASSTAVSAATSAAIADPQPTSPAAAKAATA